MTTVLQQCQQGNEIESQPRSEVSVMKVHVARTVNTNLLKVRAWNLLF
jgi:hypothetical protein